MLNILLRIYLVSTIIAMIVFYQKVIDKIISKWIESGGLR